MNYMKEPLPSCPTALGPGLNISRWYAVYTYPRHEKVAAEYIRAKDIEVFLPTFATENRWKDRRVKVESPVFPGYVFTRINLSERNRVLSTPGVIRMLSFNGTPAPIDDTEIEAVRLCIERNVVFKPHSFFEIGDRVRVRSGILEGLEGLVSRCKNERRLIIPISLIGQSVSVEIDVQLLETLDEQNISNHKCMDISRWNAHRKHNEPAQSIHA